MTYYKTPTCFGTEVPSSAGRSVQSNVDPTHQSGYYVAFIEFINILNIAILKYIKLMTINVQRVPHHWTRYTADVPQDDISIYDRHRCLYA